MSEACHKRHAERDCRTRQTQRRLAGGDQGLPPLLWPSPLLHPHREGCLPCLLAAWSSLPAVWSACHARNNMHSRHTKTRRGHAEKRPNANATHVGAALSGSDSCFLPPKGHNPIEMLDSKPTKRLPFTRPGSTVTAICTSFGLRYPTGCTKMRLQMRSAAACCISGFWWCSSRSTSHNSFAQAQKTDCNVCRGVAWHRRPALATSFIAARRASAPR